MTKTNQHLLINRDVGHLARGSGAKKKMEILLAKNKVSVCQARKQQCSPLLMY